jgi:hypothetical protein
MTKQRVRPGCRGPSSDWPGGFRVIVSQNLAGLVKARLVQVALGQTLVQRPLLLRSCFVVLHRFRVLFGGGAELERLFDVVNGDRVLPLLEFHARQVGKRRRVLGRQRCCLLVLRLG